MNQETKTTNPEIITIDEVASMLSIDERTLYRRCRAGQIPYFRVGNHGAIRFVKSKVLQWIEDQHPKAYQNN